jgi:hypothetical protein
MYEFIEVDKDTTKLKYKDKEFLIKRDVGLLKDLQSINVKAKRRMVMELAKEGLTTKDLVIEKNINGKKIMDNSNLTEMENSYVQQESLNVFDNLVNKFCGMSIAELIMDIGILDEKQSEEFGNKLINAFTNVPLDELNTP